MNKANGDYIGEPVQVTAIEVKSKPKSKPETEASIVYSKHHSGS